MLPTQAANAHRTSKHDQSNVLHRSDQNRSDRPRWAFICCYNTKHNDPYEESRHPRYSPLEIWDDARVLGRR